MLSTAYQATAVRPTLSAAHQATLARHLNARLQQTKRELAAARAQVATLTARLQAAEQANVVMLPFGINKEPVPVRVHVRCGGPLTLDYCYNEDEFISADDL